MGTWDVRWAWAREITMQTNDIKSFPNSPLTPPPLWIPCYSSGLCSTLCLSYYGILRYVHTDTQTHRHRHTHTESVFSFPGGLFELSSHVCECKASGHKCP
jgi:hypothetical protein